MDEFVGCFPASNIEQLFVVAKTHKIRVLVKVPIVARNTWLVPRFPVWFPVFPCAVLGIRSTPTVRQRASWVFAVGISVELSTAGVDGEKRMK